MLIFLKLKHWRLADGSVLPVKCSTKDADPGPWTLDLDLALQALRRATGGLPVGGNEPPRENSLERLRAHAASVNPIPGALWPRPLPVCPSEAQSSQTRPKHSVGQMTTRLGGFTAMKSQNENRGL